MRNAALLALTLATLLGVAGCGVLEPALPKADPGIPATWPQASQEATAAGATAADIGWREFFTDPHLQELIGRALTGNRDLRVAVLNVERVRQLYRVQRADRVPSVDAVGAMTRRGGDAGTSETFTADLGVTGFELDLFGRVRNQSEAALQRYFAQEEARRSAQLALIAEVANAYLTLAADQDQLRVARETLRTREESHTLTEKRHELGAVSALDVSQSRTLVESARADAARYAGQVAQDVNALNVLVGSPIEAALLPAGLSDSVTELDPLPAGLPSTVLLRRPDVLQSEHLLRAANADIGAARAAFFPSITLTGAVGSASSELSSLFDGGTQTWSFIPSIRVPIFEGGRLRANLGVAKADRDIALASYEKSIQQAFREVADSLALESTLADQRTALAAVVDAATQAEALSDARYRAGRDSYLTRLDAQRTLYVAQQALITTRRAEQSNRVALFKVLGGGWREHTP